MEISLCQLSGAPASKRSRRSVAVVLGDGREAVGPVMAVACETAEIDFGPQFWPTDDSRSINERRWLVLYDKHEAAVRLYLSNQNAEALRALRRG